MDKFGDKKRRKKMRKEEEAGGEKDVDKRKEKNGEKEKNKQSECVEGEKGIEISDMEKMQLEELPQDCLMEVFERLSPANLLKMAQANKQMNKFVEVKLRVKIKKVVMETSEMKLISCRHRNFDKNGIVYLNWEMFAQKESEETAEPEENGKEFHKTRAKDMFLKILARVTSVKSIDFGMQELTNEVLQEVTRLCPEIECIAVSKSVVDEDVWNDFFNRIGRQISHFKWDVQKNIPKSSRILEMVALKCLNIKEVNFYLGTLTRDLIVLLKKMPKSCFVEINADSVFQAFDDTIDCLIAQTISWSAFRSRNQRLTKLKFYSIENADGPQFKVEFAALKDLIFYSTKMTPQTEFNLLSTSRFPKLEMLQFRPTSDLTEDHYYNLFKNMPELKEIRIGNMIIQMDEENVDEGVLPKAAVLQLKKLQKILLMIVSDAPKWQPTNLIQQLEWYVDEIPTLKCFAVDISEKNTNFKEFIAYNMKQMKSKQNRVEIIAMPYSESKT